MASPFLADSSSSSASSPLSYLIPRQPLPSSSLVAQAGFSSCGAALAQQAGAYGGNYGFAVPAGGGVDAVRQGGRHAGHPPLPRPPPRQCPRCRSGNTKFCYYNNYSRKQPRYFCRACRRHWTEGGTLRDVPVGGGRKNRRNAAGAKAAGKATSTTTTSTEAGTAGHVQGSASAGAGALDEFVPADILRQMLFQPAASFAAVGGGCGYSIDLGAWQQMAAATAPQQGASDAATVGETAPPAADANCGAGGQFWSGWQPQDDMSGFDAPF